MACLTDVSLDARWQRFRSCRTRLFLRSHGDSRASARPLEGIRAVAPLPDEREDGFNQMLL
jgi:hypothetical protein